MLGYGWGRACHGPAAGAPPAEPAAAEHTGVSRNVSVVKAAAYSSDRTHRRGAGPRRRLPSIQLALPGRVCRPAVGVRNWWNSQRCALCSTRVRTPPSLGTMSSYGTLGSPARRTSSAPHSLQRNLLCSMGVTTAFSHRVYVECHRTPGASQREFPCAVRGAERHQLRRAPSTRSRSHTVSVDSPVNVDGSL
jgi:hypothetical protein